MTIIEDYILLSKTMRQAHLKLDEPCINRGHDDVSSYMWGVLANRFDTTYPTGSKIMACHACHNSACSNQYHVYWGTREENAQDAKANGKKSVWECTVIKYGEEQAKLLNRHASGKHWINKDGMQKYCNPKEIQEFILQGWKIGMLTRKKRIATLS